VDQDAHRIVLIAERHGAVRSLYALILQEAGYDTLDSGRCQEAFDLAVSRCPHVVLAACDEALDGVELARLLAHHAGTRTIPVILLAGSARPDLGVVAEDAWIHAVLAKPCAQDELLEQVKQAVAYSLELRRMLAVAPPAPADAPADPATSATDPIGERLSPCPSCGQPALTPLGETRYSVVLRCAACQEVIVERRR
jgi:CheY-like chemotaxis protein